MFDAALPSFTTSACCVRVRRLYELSHESKSAASHNALALLSRVAFFVSELDVIIQSNARPHSTQTTEHFRSTACMKLQQKPLIAPSRGTVCVGINCNTASVELRLMPAHSKYVKVPRHQLFANSLNHSVDYAFCLCHRFEIIG